MVMCQQCISTGDQGIAKANYHVLWVNDVHSDFMIEK